MSKTIKQIADEIGVSKQRVYRYIKNRITDAHQTTSVIQIDDAAEKSIKSHFFEKIVSGDVHHDVHQNRISDAVNDAVINMLKKELEIKNEQIKDLSARLEESNRALIATTEALQNTTDSLKAAQALHAGTMKKQIEGPKLTVGEKIKNIFRKNA